MHLKKGFSLIELMVVVAIIGLLAMIAVPSFNRYLAKAKRAEAYLNLNSIYAAQKAHWAEHGSYASMSNLGWQAEGQGNNENSKYYTYTISGGDTGFLALATGDIDGDGQMDILSVDHHNNMVIVQDDLA